MKDFQEQEKFLRDLFPEKLPPEDRYKKIISLGTSLPSPSSALCTEKNLVPGCQSLLYLSCQNQKNTLFFTAHSDALISKGLAALMLFLYNETSPETLLKNPPSILVEIGVATSISPSRAIGLQSIYKKMQNFAIMHLVK